jgi:hypothetical protein
MDTALGSKLMEYVALTDGYMFQERLEVVGVTLFENRSFGKHLTNLARKLQVAIDLPNDDRVHQSFHGGPATVDAYRAINKHLMKHLNDWVTQKSDHVDVDGTPCHSHEEVMDVAFMKLIGNRCCREDSLNLAIDTVDALNELKSLINL